MDFSKIVLASVIIGLPLGYLTTRSWLNNFVYRIDPGPWYFIATALIALFTAFVTVGIQTIKASLANPVNLLRQD